MEWNKPVSEMGPGNEVEGFYLLKAAASKVTTSGKPFLAATVGDKTGSIDVKVWDYAGPVGAADVGKIVKLRGEVSSYRGALQFTAGRIRLADPNDQYDISAIVPVAPIDTDGTLAMVESLISSLEDPDYRQVCTVLLDRHRQAFRSLPAGKSVHHSFLSSLLMHTANMLKIADFLSGIYGQTVNRSLLLTGTLLHDFGKEREFSLSELGTVTDYSTEGQLLGHLVMGAMEVDQLCRERNIPREKALLLEHLILSHHGEPEFGAAVRPVCAEAELLSLIDMLDSRMEIYAEALHDVTPGQFSQRVFALEKRLYRHE